MTPSYTYDMRADAIYVKLSEKPVAKTVQMNDSVNVDFDDESWQPVGVEIIGVSRATPDALAQMYGLVRMPDFIFVLDVLRSARTNMVQFTGVLEARKVAAVLPVMPEFTEPPDA